MDSSLDISLVKTKKETESMVKFKQVLCKVCHRSMRRYKIPRHMKEDGKKKMKLKKTSVSKQSK